MKVDLMKTDTIIIRSNGVAIKHIELREINSVSSETFNGKKIVTINID